MLTLQTEYITILESFARLFSKRIWEHVHNPVMSHTESGPCRTVRGEKNAVVGIVL
jgi:hypothetical protein